MLTVLYCDKLRMGICLFLFAKQYMMNKTKPRSSVIQTGQQDKFTLLLAAQAESAETIFSSTEYASA